MNKEQVISELNELETKIGGEGVVTGKFTWGDEHFTVTLTSSGNVTIHSASAVRPVFYMQGPLCTMNASNRIESLFTFIVIGWLSRPLI